MQKNDKVRSQKWIGKIISFIYFYPSPFELYSEGEARCPISLSLIFFLFVLQLFYFSF